MLDKVFDEAVKRAMDEGLVSRHVNANGTLVRANASYKSFVPIEVALAPRSTTIGSGRRIGTSAPGPPTIELRLNTDVDLRLFTTDALLREAKLGGPGAGTGPGLPGP